VKIGIRLEIFLVSLALIAVSMVAADVYLSRRLDTELAGREERDLFVRLTLAERSVAQSSAQSYDIGAWDALADELGRSAAARATIIARDGKVLGDSELAGRELAEVANHASRPEVVDALARGRGSSTRQSSTLGARMMYVAMPFRSSSGVAGVLRLALPLTQVDDAIGRLRRLVLLASGIALGMAVILSSLAAHWMSRTVRALTAVARRMAAGDLSVRTPVERHDEVTELSRALNQLATNLSSALQDLRSERDLLGRVLDSMREGVLLLDPNGRIVLANPALRRMLMLGADVTGKLPLEMVRSSELQRTLDEVSSSADMVTAELELGDLEPRRLLVRAAPFPSSGGALAVFVDVTELRRLETIRRDFVANVSHELRTPVTAVRSAAETLRTAGMTAADAEDFLDIIERNAERLQHLVQDLLDLARIESRELKLSMEAVELVPALERAFDLLGDRAERKRIGLSADVADGLDPVLCDRRALEQVLVNLLDNAIKYCPEGAAVLVRARPEAELVRIAVDDNGPGIEPRHLPRLFERFYRVDAGRSRELGGTGLGLSIVKHLVEAMGGRVSVESTPGSGTSFAFTLPAGERPAP
jgi:two-component system phosphate regulon sensor histidine kinase PhoR